jgi:histidinol-phosphate aminotransferase
MAQTCPVSMKPMSHGEAGTPTNRAPAGSQHQVLAPVSARPDIAAMVGYHSPQVACRIRLNTNESPFSPPMAWQEALADEVALIDFRRYPDRSATALRRAIGAHHGCDPDQIFVANGSNEAIQTLCLTYGGHDRSVLVFEPGYAMHTQIARTSGSPVITALRTDELHIDLVAARHLIAEHQPSIVFVSSPNNPTGMVEPQSVIEELLELTPGVLVVDEAYGQFATWSAIDMIRDDRALCVLRTFSKTWAMAGARLGYAVAPTWMTEEFDKVVLPYHLDAVKQVAGRLALKYDTDMRSRVAELVAQRQRVMTALCALDITVWPSQANFVLFKPHHSHADDVWQYLVDHDVLVRNCSSWPGLTNCLRVTIGTEEENMIFLQQLTDALAATRSHATIANS